MPDLLSCLWPHIDVPEPLFFKPAFVGSQDCSFDQLAAAGYLRQADQADTLPCPVCTDRHLEEVFVWRDAAGASRFYIPCPAWLRVEISPDLLRQWTINLERVLEAVAQALSLTGSCTQLIPGRLWRLGRTKWRGLSRDVIFARGLGGSDGRFVASHIAHTIRPIVFVADRLPDPTIWPGRRPPVIALSQVAAATDDGLAIDVDAVYAAMLPTEDAATLATVDDARLKLMIRHQVKAEAKSQLTDDILLAAYQQEGSVRKAASFLSERTGQLVTKDKVQNALRRCGGAGVVARRRDQDRSATRQMGGRRPRSQVK
jgi:hypothetical protein